MNQLFSFSPKAKSIADQTLYLTINPSTLEITASVGEKDHTPSIHQQFEVISRVIGGHSYSGLIYNPATDYVITAPNNHKPVLAVNINNLKVEDRAEWNILPNVGEYGAIQLKANIDMNLNVRMDQPIKSGTEILAWNWDDGAPNEMWELSPVYQMTN